MRSFMCAVVVLGCLGVAEGAETLLFQVETEHVIPDQNYSYAFQVLGDNPGEIIWSNVSGPSLEVLASDISVYDFTQQLKTAKPEDMLRISVYQPLSETWKPFGVDVSDDLMTRYVVSHVGSKFTMQAYGIEGGAIPEPATIALVMLLGLCLLYRFR